MTGYRIGIALGVAACVGGHQTSTTPPPGSTPPTAIVAETDGAGGRHQGPTCQALGEAGTSIYDRVLADASFETQLALTIDADGNIAFVQDALGVTVQTPSGRTIYTFGFGSETAFDATSNLFVAGAFTQPTDFGLGVVTPNGNVDVFVAELDRTGRVIVAKALGLCGAGLDALAIDRATGRIALSGSAMGTIVLDANLAPVFALAIAGQLAFDARGGLVIAGANGSSGFVEKVDNNGATLFVRSFSSDLAIDVRALAIDSHGNIVLGGNFSGTLDLFGNRVVERVFEGEITADTFLAKLDPNGNVVFVQSPGLPGRTLDVIATGLHDEIVVAGADLGHLAFDRITTTLELTAGGAIIFDKAMFPASGYGEALAVVTDSCGAIFVGAIAADDPRGGAPIRSYLTGIAP